MNDFHTEMAQEASDKFGAGELNGAFKVGAEWTYKKLNKAIEAAKALEDMCIVYRTQGRPSDKLLDRCKKAREFLSSQS